MYVIIYSPRPDARWNDSDSVVLEGLYSAETAARICAMLEQQTHGSARFMHKRGIPYHRRDGSLVNHSVIQ